MWGLLGAIITVGVFVIMFLVVGQLLHKKYSKIAYSFWGLALLLLISFIYTQNTRNTSLGDKDLDKYIGTYKINIQSSNYDFINLTEYNDLELNVNADHTFNFSRETPFFDNTSGKWRHMDDGDISWTEITVGNGELNQADVETDKWIFKGRELKNRNFQNQIVFIRQ